MVFIFLYWQRSIDESNHMASVTTDNSLLHCWIWGSHSSDYEEYYLLGCNIPPKLWWTSTTATLYYVPEDTTLLPGLLFV
jgi:hypothetical protein